VLGNVVQFRINSIGACFAITLIHSPPMVTEDQLGMLSFVVSPLTLHHRVSRLCEQKPDATRHGSYCHAP